jgi:hypothetical protein
VMPTRTPLMRCFILDCASDHAFIPTARDPGGFCRATTKRFHKRSRSPLSIHNIINSLAIYDDVQDNFNEL